MRDVIDALMEDGEIAKIGEVEERALPRLDVEELVEESTLALKIVDVLILLTVAAIILILAGII